MLKSKIEAFDAFKNFKALVETGPERRITTFRTDRGVSLIQMNSICIVKEVV